MKLIALALGLIIIVSFGCNKSNTSESSEPQVEIAYQLIDDGRYSDAIDLFWVLLQNEDTPTIRIGLASAYSARAGILVQNYWDLILPLIKTQPDTPNEKIEKLKKDWKLHILKFPSDIQKILTENEDKIFKAYENSEKIKAQFEKIPLITSIDQMGDINMARSIIKDVPTKGSHLYRALLSLILIRFEANESIKQFNNSIESLNQATPCTHQFKSWINHLESTATLISDFILDLKFSFPSKVSEIEPFEMNFNKHSEIITSINSLLKSNLCR